MKTKLRGHHLICLNFFRGEGYSDDFIKNIYAVIAEQVVEVADGPDDVCKVCPYLIKDMCSNPDYANEMIRRQDREALRLLGFRHGMAVSWKDISERIPGIIGEWKAQFCTGCGYRRVCFEL